MATAVAKTSTRKKSGGAPLAKILLGVVLIGGFVYGSIISITTSEAFYLQGATANLTPNWSILAQPVWLMQGHLTSLMVGAVLWGWGVELTFLICVAGYEVAHEGVRRNSQKMAYLFMTGMVGIIVFDGWSDFQYGNVAHGIWGQVAFAAIKAFTVLFFGTVGLHLIQTGISEVRH